MNSLLYKPRFVLLVWLALLITLFMYLYGTSPDRVGPGGVTIFFIFVYLFCVISLQGLALIIQKYRSPTGVIHWRILYSLVFALLPVAILGLGSLDQLVLRDIMIFFGLLAVTAFYLTKQASKQK